MNAQKIAITIPADLLKIIDASSRRQKVSRSRLISRMLAEKIKEQQALALKQAYDEVFADAEIRREQLETAADFDSVGGVKGQRW